MRYEEAIAVQDTIESVEAVGGAFRRMAAAAGKVTMAALDLAEELQKFPPDDGSSHSGAS